MTSEARPRRLESGALGLLRAAALIALAIGAAGSLGFLLHAGRRTPRFLLILFVLWVLSPFVALAWAHVVSKRWSVLTRTTLHGVMLTVALGSLATYAADALGPPRAKAAVVYLMVPPVSWLVMVVAVSLAALLAARRPARTK